MGQPRPMDSAASKTGSCTGFAIIAKLGSQNLLTTTIKAVCVLSPAAWFAPIGRRGWRFAPKDQANHGLLEPSPLLKRDEIFEKWQPTSKAAAGQMPEGVAIRFGGGRRRATPRRAVRFAEEGNISQNKAQKKKWDNRAAAARTGVECSAHRWGGGFEGGSIDEPRRWGFLPAGLLNG